MSDTGAMRIAARYDSDPYLAIMAHRPAAHAADRDEDGERDREHEHGERRRSGRVVAVDVLEDVQRRDLGLERDVPGDEHDGAELADRPRERERHAGQQ